MSKIAISRHPAPSVPSACSRLQFRSDQRTLGSDRNHDSISYHRQDARGVLPAQARPWPELLDNSGRALCRRRSDRGLFLLGGRHFIFLPPLRAVRLDHVSDRARSSPVQDCRDRLVMGVPLSIRNAQIGSDQFE